MKFLYAISVLFFILHPERVFADSASSITVISAGKTRQSPLESKGRLDAINHHPNFKDEGVVRYEGVKVDDLVGPGNKNEELYFVDKSALYMVGLRREEVSENSLLAITKNGKKLSDAEFGTQLIYSPATLEKHPNLAHRNFWLWWTKAIIVGSRAYPFDLGDIASLESSAPFVARTNFPKLYGRATFADFPTVTQKNLRRIRTQEKSEIIISQITGQKVSLAVKNGLTYLIDDPEQPTYSMLSGGITLYAVDARGKNIETFEEAWHFVSGIWVK